MTKKKVVFLVGTLQTGGIERSVTDWCVYHKATNQIEPIVVCIIKRSGPFVEVLERHGVRVLECKLAEPGFVFRLRGLLINLKPDVVHSQVAFSMPWQILGMKLARVPRIVFTQQNEYQNWNPMGAKLRLRTYFALFFRFIDYYTCVSEKVRDSLCHLTGLSKERFRIIPNAVNTDMFKPNKAVRSAQRAKLGIDDKVFLVGMVARFSEQKGHTFLIHAVKELAQRQSMFRIMFVGQGELLEPMKEQAKKLGVESIIDFYGRSLQVEALVQAMDCFILSSLWEGMPLAMLEAMASGVPVVGTDVAGIREVIVNRENGLLIPSRDPGAIAKALEELMTDKVFRERLAESGRASVIRKYSISSVVSQYEEFYG